MKLLALAFILTSVPAFATEVAIADPAPEPTVTLTQAQLQSLINVEIAKAQLQPIYDKINKAFAPPAPPPKTPEPEKKP